MVVEPAKGPFVTQTAQPDGRMHAPSYERNTKPVTDGLLSLAGHMIGSALEIGSGTGQHITTLAAALPNLTWQGSDPTADYRVSTDAWTRHRAVPLPPTLNLDASTDWPQAPEIQSLGPLSLVLCMNVIHIAPINVAQGILNGAGKTLVSGGFTAFYGPFRENGAHTGDGNIAFDATLRSHDPEWGIRDVGEITQIATQAGLQFHDLMPMPANNRILVFRR